jgi:hypothetical protein
MTTGIALLAIEGSSGQDQIRSARCEDTKASRLEGPEHLIGARRTRTPASRHAKQIATAMALPRQTHPNLCMTSARRGTNFLDVELKAAGVPAGDPGWDNPW